MVTVTVTLYAWYHRSCMLSGVWRDVPQLGLRQRPAPPRPLPVLFFISFPISLPSVDILDHSSLAFFFFFLFILFFNYHSIPFLSHPLLSPPSPSREISARYLFGSLQRSTPHSNSPPAFFLRFPFRNREIFFPSASCPAESYSSSPLARGDSLLLPGPIGLASNFLNPWSF